MESISVRTKEEWIRLLSSAGITNLADIKCVMMVSDGPLVCGPFSQTDIEQYIIFFQKSEDCENYFKWESEIQKELHGEKKS